MATIVFGRAEDLDAKDAAGGWIYLGKRDRLNELTAAFGRPPEPLGDRLHRQARRLRRPFLDLVADLGERERDAPAWWAGTLAWKDPAASDLFLLCCYQALCLELVKEGKPLAVAVEDDWLLSQLLINLRDNHAAEFRGAGHLPAAVAAAALLGAGRRLKWLARMIMSRLRQSRQSKGRTPDLTVPRQVILYSHLLPRSLVGKWADHYLTGLDEELTAAGYKVLRIADTDATGFEAEVAERSDLVVPLILYAPPTAFLRAFFAVPPPVRTAPLDGVSIELLLRREWWHDISRAGRCATLLLESALDALFSKARFEACVYPWENQPQERMLVLAARRAGVRTVGGQHTTLPDFMLHFHAGRGEADRAPMPDRLLACGAYPLEKLRREGFPVGRLLLGGSRRYPPGKAPGQAPIGDGVLALLPLDPATTRTLLGAMARLSRQVKDKIVIKAHPAMGLKKEDLGFTAELADGPLDPVLARCGPVVFTGTTSGIEAWLAGHPVIRFRAEAQLDVDPCDMLGDEDLPTADEWTLPEKLAEVRARPRLPGENALKALDGLFSAVDKEVWLSAVRGTC